jgi:hypothetical protein
VAFVFYSPLGFICCGVFWLVWFLVRGLEAVGWSGGRTDDEEEEKAQGQAAMAERLLACLLDTKESERKPVCRAFVFKNVVG